MKRKKKKIHLLIFFIYFDNRFSGFPPRNPVCTVRTVRSPLSTRARNPSTRSEKLSHCACEKNLCFCRLFKDFCVLFKKKKFTIAENNKTLVTTLYFPSRSFSFLLCALSFWVPASDLVLSLDLLFLAQISLRRRF